MTAVAHQHRLAAKAGFSTPRPAPELLQKKPDIEPHSRTRHCAKLSQAGEVTGTAEADLTLLALAVLQRHHRGLAAHRRERFERLLAEVGHHLLVAGAEAEQEQIAEVEHA